MSGAEKPVFEVRSAGKTYRIWASGRTEGFDDPVIFNRIPLLLGEAIAQERDRARKAANAAS